MIKPFVYQSSVDRILNKPTNTGLDISTRINPLLPTNPVGMTQFQPIGLNSMPPAVNTGLDIMQANSDSQDQSYQDVLQLRHSIFGVNQQLLGETLTKSLSFCDNSSQNYQGISSVLSTLNFQPKHF